MRFISAILVILVLALPVFANGTWPRSFAEGGTTISLYAPETLALSGLVAKGRMAFSVATSQENTVFGALSFDATFSTQQGTDSLLLTGFVVTGMSVPDSLASRQTFLKAEIEKEVLAWKIKTKKKTLEASLKSGQQNAAAPKDLKHEPPAIMVREKLAILVVLDGEPKLEKVEGTSFQYVKNSVIPLILDPSSKQYYLPNGTDWYTSQNLMGDWMMTTSVPSGIRELVKLDEDQAGSSTKPNLAVYVVTKPTELLSFDGPAQWEPLPGSQLLYVKNTESDVFKDIASQKTFVLLSGRWFSATSFQGPWTFVESNKLPAAFASIPPEGPKGDVLTSVAGTKQADQAVLDAIVPTTAAVDRATTKLTVVYDGDPWFEKISGTSIEYAVNTKTPVLRVKSVYYACDNGIWFRASSASGPWAVSDTRPDEVEKIPSSNPVSNVKYVYVYSSTPAVVYVGYVPAYYGTYIYGPTIVYGTGYYYNPWYGPHYYPRPYTYGFHVHYTAHYGWGYGYSYGMGWAHVTVRYGAGGYYHPGYHSAWGAGCYRPPYHGYPGGAYRPPYNSYNRPNNGNRPNVSPRVPTNAVNRPSTMPSNRTSARPSTQPAYRPSVQTQRPSTMPASRPMNTSRPSTSPSARPTSRPSGGGGRRR